MPVKLIKLLVSFVLCLVFSAPLGAEPRPQPDTAKVPAQEGKDPVPEPGPDESTRSKIKHAYLRVWNFSGQNSREALGVFTRLEKSLDGDTLIWLGRGMGYGTMGHYVELPVGVYHFLIITEAMENLVLDKPVKAGQSGKLESKDLKINLVNKDYVTLLLQEVGGKIKSTFIEDSKLTPEVHTLRALNLTAMDSASLCQVQNNITTSLFESLPPDQWLSIVYPKKGMISLELCYKDPQGFPLKQGMEIDTRSTRSTSVLLFYDRYGRITVQGVQDAPKDAASSSK